MGIYTTWEPSIAYIFFNPHFFLCDYTLCLQYFNIEIGHQEFCLQIYSLSADVAATLYLIL